MTKKIFLESHLSFLEIYELNDKYSRIGLEPKSVVHEGREYSRIASDDKTLSTSKRALGIFLMVLMSISIVGLLALIDRKTRRFTEMALYDFVHQVDTYVNKQAIEADLCTQVFLAMRSNDLNALPPKLQEDPSSIFKIDDHFNSPFMTSVVLAKKAGNLNDRWHFVAELLKLGQLSDFDDNKWLNWLTLLLFDKNHQHQHLLDKLIDIKNPALLSPRILCALSKYGKFDLLDQLIDQVPAEYIDQDINNDNFFNDVSLEMMWPELHRLSSNFYTTPLKMAVRTGHMALASKMLTLNPNANLERYELFEIAFGGHWELLHQIVTGCTNLDVHASHLLEILHHACEYHQWDVVDAMLTRFPEAVAAGLKDGRSSELLKDVILDFFTNLYSQATTKTIMHLMLLGAKLPESCAIGLPQVYDRICTRLHDLFHRIALVYCDQQEDLQGNAFAILPNDVQHTIVRNMIAVHCPELESIPVTLVLEKLLAYFKLKDIATETNNEKITLALQRSADL